MADSDKTVTYAIDGNADGLVGAMKKAQDAGVQSAKGITDAYGQLGGAFKLLQGHFGSLLAVLGGGAAFKAAVGATVEWGAETGKLSKQLQVSTAEATAFQVATRHLGLEASVLVDASDKMARQLSKNESAFKTMGVETRNANGSWRSTGQLLPEVMDKLRGISNVTQQNIAGQQLFGKAWSELRGLMKLSSEEMERARVKAKELNLEVDPGQVRKYREAMNDVKLISTSLSVQIGNALLPALTKMGKFMGEEGPVLGKTFGLVLEGVGFAAAATWLAIKDMGDALGAMAAQAAALLSRDLAGFRAIGALRDAESKKNEAAYQRLKDNFGKPPEAKSASTAGDGGEMIDFEKAKQAKEHILALWEAQLAERKLKLQETAQVEGRFAEMSKADEQAFWRAKMAVANTGSTEQLAVRKKLAELGLAIMKDGFETELAGLHTSLEAYKNNLDARRVLLTQEADLVAQKFGQTSKEYEAVQAKLTALAREASAQRRQIAQVEADQARNLALAALDAQQADIQLDQALGRATNAQALALEAQLEQQRFQLRSQALQDKLQLAALDPDRSPVEIARINAEIQQLETQHQAALAQIRGRASIEASAYSRGITSNLQSGFESVFAQLGTRIRSIGGLLQGLFQVVVSSITSMLAKIAAQWLINAIRQKVTTVATALGQIQANAAVAGAGGVASMAAAPFPLNLGAPAFGLAMAGLAGSFAAGLAIPSAAGGWEVPRDTLAMVHENEMILPAAISQPLKQQLASGGLGGGAGGGIVEVKLQAHPMPGNYFMVHRDDLVAAIHSAVRDGAIKRV